MIARVQLPAYSPMTLRALFAGAGGVLGIGDDAALAQRFRDEWKCTGILQTSSGTVALSLALRAAVGATARPVALPAYACYDIATAAIGAGVRVVLYDLDPNTLAPNFDSLRRALAMLPAAVVVLHLFGVPVDIHAIAQIAAASDTVVIEDAAQAFGALVNGRPAGTLASLAVMSFGRGKGFSGGSGGALLANDDKGGRLLEKVQQDLPRKSGTKQLALACAHWMMARPLLYRIPASLPFLHLGETIFRQPAEPAALSRASSRMLAVLWEDAQASARMRFNHAERLRNSLISTGKWNSPPVASHNRASYLRLPLWSPSALRTELLDDKARRLGIASAYPLPLVSLPEFAVHCINASEQFTGAELLAERLITLPTHELLNEGDLLRVERWLSDSSTV